MVSSDFTHFDEAGRPQMVDVGGKPFTIRTAVARVNVLMNENTKDLIEGKEIHKGDVLTLAEVAGVMAAKRTPDLIPLCHPVPLTKVNLETKWLSSDEVSRQAEVSGDWESTTTTVGLAITATVTAEYKTGVEMEALTACSVAALTVYDMCKAVDRGMTIMALQLVHKSGGKSGTYDRSTAE